jgi:TM2 domain-containing membrane protein YozV
MRKIVIVSSLLIICSISFSQTFTPDQKKALDRANMAKEIAQQSNNQEDWKALIDEYKKAITAIPDYAPIVYDLGSCYKQLSDFDNAISTFKKYLILDPSSPYKDEILTDINKMEYLKERENKQGKANDNLIGYWASPQKAETDSRPFWIFKIDEFNSELRVTIDPKSVYYRVDYTYPTAIALKKGSKLNFMFTTDASTDIKGGLYQASDALNAVDMVANYIAPLNNLPFGIAGNVLSMIPASGPKNEKVQYVFNLDISNPEKVDGKVNIKKYVSTEAGVKVVSDKINNLELVKTSETEVAALKKLYKANTTRKPALAVTYSILLPGCGQFYNKQFVKGSLFLLPYTFSAIGIIGTATVAKEYRDMYNSGDSDAFETWQHISGLQTIYIIIGSAILATSAIEAGISAHKINKANGFLLGDIYENNHYKINLRPSIQPLYSQGRPEFYAGVSLALKIK